MFLGFRVTDLHSGLLGSLREKEVVGWRILGFREASF